jgi:hypothetical protein
MSLVEELQDTEPSQTSAQAAGEATTATQESPAAIAMAVPPLPRAHNA